MESGNQVEVLLSLLVVKKDPLLKGFFDFFDGDLFSFDQAGSNFKGIQSPAGIAVRIINDHLRRLAFELEVELTQPVFLICQSLLDNPGQSLLRKGI